MSHPAKFGPSGQTTDLRTKPRLVGSLEYCGLPPTWESKFTYTENGISISIKIWKGYYDTEYSTPFNRRIACPPPAFSHSQGPTQLMPSSHSSTLEELLFLWGWEARASASGTVYFIDHNKQTTTSQVKYLPKDSYYCELDKLGRLTLAWFGTHRLCRLASRWDYKWNDLSDGLLYVNHKTKTLTRLHTSYLFSGTIFLIVGFFRTDLVNLLPEPATTRFRTNPSNPFTESRSTFFVFLGGYFEDLILPSLDVFEGS
jgi:hypothetical protein